MLRHLADEILEADERGDRAQKKLDRLNEREDRLRQLKDELEARRKDLVRSKVVEALSHSTTTGSIFSHKREPG